MMGTISRLKLREEIVLNHVTLNLIGYYTFCKLGHKLQVANWSKILET